MPAKGSAKRKRRDKPRPRSIVTRQGDEGLTRLYSGERIWKSSLRVDLCGDLDELNAILGMAGLRARSKRIERYLKMIQDKIILISGEIMTLPQRTGILKKRLRKEDIRDLENIIDWFEQKGERPSQFVAPGGNFSSAYCDYARAVARRCERKIVQLIQRKGLKNLLLLVWLNRLSDCLYLFARYKTRNAK